jgi:hypothetical protein
MAGVGEIAALVEREILLVTDLKAVDSQLLVVPYPVERP